MDTLEFFKARWGLQTTVCYSLPTICHRWVCSSWRFTQSLKSHLGGMRASRWLQRTPGCQKPQDPQRASTFISFLLLLNGAKSPLCCYKNRNTSSVPPIWCLRVVVRYVIFLAKHTNDLWLSCINMWHFELYDLTALDNTACKYCFPPNVSVDNANCCKVSNHCLMCHLRHWHLIVHVVKLHIFWDISEHTVYLL